VPGKRLWRIGAGRAGGSGRTSRPFKSGPRTPSGILSSTQTARLRTVFCPPTDTPFLSLLHFPSAHGRGWEEFRLGPGGSGLATRDRVTNSHPSVRARGKPSDTLDFTVSVLSFVMVFIWFKFKFSVLHSYLFGFRFSSFVEYITAVYKPPAGGKH
jgi:hypothetical protein